MGIFRSACETAKWLLYELYDWGFYREARIGKDGVPFMLVKFRTMERGVLEPDESQNTSGIFRNYNNDPRPTVINTIVRKARIDEFPNLINVIRGDMALVGPRAILAKEEKMLPPGVAGIRRMVKPGCFNPWGAMDGEYSDENRIKADMRYIWRLSREYAPKVKMETALRHAYNILSGYRS